MNHVYVFALVINLVVGAIVFSRVFQAYKKDGHRFLGSLLFYIVFFNLQVLAYFASKYVYTNIFAGSSTAEMRHPVIFIFMLALFFSAEAGITYSLYRTTAYLRDKTPTVTIKRVFILWICSFTGLHIFGLIRMFIYKESLFLSFVEMIWVLHVNILIMLIMAITLLDSRRKRENPHSVRQLAYLFLGGYTAYLVPNVYYYSTGKGIGNYADPLILLGINLVPVIWMTFFYAGPAAALRDDETTRLDVKRTFEKYNISGREEEIIEAIIRGKSNREIADQLYLSFHTVKNHVYNIYRKFNVRSRSQLIHKVDRSSREE